MKSRANSVGLESPRIHTGYKRVYKLSNLKAEGTGVSSFKHTFKLPGGSETRYLKNIF